MPFNPISISSEELDFQKLFEKIPGLYLILKPSFGRFIIIAASDAYLKATKTIRQEILNKDIFEVFPENPADPHGNGVENLKKSLNKVCELRTSDMMPIQKYDIKRPQSEGSGFEEKYWNPANSPVLNSENEVVYIIHQVEDVTEFIQTRQKEIELKKLTDQLYGQIKELHQFKNYFFENINHEIRTPLSLITAPAQQVLNDENLTYQGKKNMEVLIRNSKSLLKNVTSLLETTKMQLSSPRFNQEQVPLLTPPSAQQKETLPHPEIRQKSGKKGLALIVEDNVELNGFLQELLSDDYHVEFAFNGLDGLNKAIEIQPDIIISDIMMPKMSGDKMVKEIRSRPELANTSILLLTAKTDDSLKVQLLREGAQDYISKPFLAEEILARVENLVTIKKVREILYLDALFEKALDAVIGMDTQGRIIHWNTQATKIFGWTKSEVVGENMSDIIIPPEYRQSLQKNLSLFLESGYGPKLNTRQEHVGYHKEGRAIPIELSITPIENKDTMIYFSFVRDISERKKTLEDLLLAKEAAEQANHAKSAFLANMSHEIRTPLGVVIGFSDLICDPLINIEDKKNYMNSLKRNGEHLTKLIDDILDLSKIEAEKLNIDSHVVAIHEIMSDVTSALAPKANDKGLKLSVNYSKDIPDFIKTDPLRLRQVLLNIIGNAIKFTETGSVEIELKRSVSEGENPKLHFVIHDTGLGIDRKDLDKLFQPFSQVDPSSTRRFGGAGLGLVLSKRIANLLGGNIVLNDSKKGQGSTFTITIDTGSPGELEAPLQKTSSSISKHQTQKLRLDGLQVLLAEDSPENQIVIGQFLKKAGALVDTVENGKDAVDYAQKKPYDILIFDIQMPIMDGNEATIELRRKGINSPIIALTAHALKEDRQRCLQSGFNEHLSKPVDRQGLISSIAHLCHLET